MTKLKPKNLDEMTRKCRDLTRQRNFHVILFWGSVLAFWLLWLTGCNENPSQEQTSPGPVPTLSVASKLDGPQPIEPKSIPLVGPTDEMWFEALRECESGENPYKVGDVGKLGGPSRGEYQIQKGRWNDALDRLGIDHNDPGWCWELWYWSRPKSEYVLYSYWARFNLKTWEQRIKAHKGIKGINNPSRKVYYERVKNIAWDLMRRKGVNDVA